MFAWGRIVPSATTYVSRLTNFTSKLLQPTSQFHSLTNGATSEDSLSETIGEEKNKETRLAKEIVYARRTKGYNEQNSQGKIRVYPLDVKYNTPEDPSKTEEDLEDGEIEDDDEEGPMEPQEPPKVDVPIVGLAGPVPLKAPETKVNVNLIEKIDRDRPRDRSDRRRHDEKGRKHMTEAEKSILHLRKREEMQRKKWEKFNRNKDAVMDPLDDDFAKNIEKTLATILNKKEKEAAAASGEEDKVKDEEKRGKKRKKGDKDRKNKQRRLESPKSEIDENEMLNVRGGSPDKKLEERRDDTPSAQSEESYDSEYSSDRSRSEERPRKREGKKMKRQNREHGRERKNRRNEQQPLKDSQGVCVFYLQGKCQKNDCPYSHEAVPPMKLELCKFYLMDCCAKGLNCIQGDNCKFAHGKPLSEGLKQILFKHLETAPRDILGGFPRMSREEALNLINITQIKLQEQQGGEMKDEAKDGRGKNEKTARNRPSRWQDPDPLPSKDLNFPLKPFQYGQDQDMRIRNSNGDIDMRTLPPTLGPIPSVASSVSSDSKSIELDLEKYKREAGLAVGSPKRDLDIRTSNILPYTASKDVDIRHPPLLANKDVDIRLLPKAFDGKLAPPKTDEDIEDEPMLQIDTGDDPGKADASSLPVDLPKTQRDLYLRIQAHQKETAVEEDSKEGFEIDENINWYSDDDDEDDNRLTIKVDSDDVKEKEPAGPEATGAGEAIMSPPQIRPLDVVGQLGDLSKIDISAEVTKLLTTMSQSQSQFPFLAKPEGASTPPPQPAASTSSLVDPRTSRQDPRMTADKQESPRADPRLSVDPRQRLRQGSTEVQAKPEKLSIYEQGCIDRNAEDADTDFRSSMRSDVDLRNLQLPFKGMQNYTPATEIDASINSHLHIPWKVITVEIPRPDYTGLKLSINDAEKTGDPRLRKIFRLSVEERDTPLSPKASPKSATTTVRVDPRLRKMEDSKTDSPAGAMSFNQQLSMLQSSAFYQSLTSNQKVLLNQEVSQRSDPNNAHDPVLNSLLSNLNIIPGTSLQSNPNLGAALSILANVSKLNPILPPGQQGSLPVNPILAQNPNMMNQMPPGVAQPGLLGAAPGIPNMPPDFPMNFDPRNGGLLGNAPMPFGGFPPDGPGNFNNFNDDFYPPNNPGNRDNRGFNRDRRRGRNFRNNPGNRNFRSRNNRANRTHSPP